MHYSRLDRVALLYVRAAREVKGSLEPRTGGLAVANAVQHYFTDPHEVEVVSRLCRRNIGIKVERDASLVFAAEAVLLAGLKQFPDSAFLAVMHGSFVIDVLSDPQRGHGIVERARSLSPSFRERLMIFSRDRERKQRMQGDSTGESAMDLVACARPPRGAPALRALAFQSPYLAAQPASLVPFDPLSPTTIQPTRRQMSSFRRTLISSWSRTGLRSAPTVASGADPPIFLKPYRPQDLFLRRMRPRPRRWRPCYVLSCAGSAQLFTSPHCHVSQLVARRPLSQAPFGPKRRFLPGLGQGL